MRRLSSASSSAVRSGMGVQFRNEKTLTPEVDNAAKSGGAGAVAHIIPLPDEHVKTGMKHYEPKQAHEYLKKNPNAIFIDCRSEMEYLFVGHPMGAILVPWID